jgi:hypothetical protein
MANDLNFSCDPNGKNNQKYVAPDLCIGQLNLSTGECADNDSKFIEGSEAEAINIAGGPINVFPLLGIYNQGSVIDITGEGYPISSGTSEGYNISDAFNSNDESWKSIQQGLDVITKPAFVGYDFGTKKTDIAMDTYTPSTPQVINKHAPPAPVKKQIRSIKIKQGNEPSSRASQIRIEASNDGETWIRVDVLNLTNVPDLVSYPVKQSSIYKMWRIIPLLFNGISSNSCWEIIELQLLEENQISLDDIQDPVLMENRDRAYSKTSVCLKSTYDLIDVQSELSRFGIDLPQQYIFTLSFAQLVKALGRPIVIGDIIEIPGEIQYDHQLNPVRKWLEVVDTAWSTDGYTPNWKPTLFRFFAQPILPSMEHRDILGTPEDRFAQTDEDFLSGQFNLNVQAHESMADIIEEASDAVPETGSDGLELMSGAPLNHDKGRTDQKDIYVEDGLPPNGIPYTEGLDFPVPGTAKDGDYHRLLYPENLKVPARLFQWSLVKNRWIFKEQDKRGIYESYKPSLSNILKASNKRDLTER